MSIRLIHIYIQQYTWPIMAHFLFILKTQLEYFFRLIQILPQKFKASLICVEETMALLPTGFKERLEQMELCRIQRLSLLQAEKELQFTNSQLLASKFSSIKSADHTCLNLQQQIASKHFLISSLKSRIHSLDSEYNDVSQQFRVLKSEVQELEELETEKERYFAAEIKEMEGFKAEIAKFADESRKEVQDLRNQAEQLKSSFMKLQGNIGSSDDSELAAAENKKSELLAEKENLDCRLASSYQIRAQLQKQLQSILMTQSQAGQKFTHSSQMRCLKP